MTREARVRSLPQDDFMHALTKKFRCRSRNRN